MQPPPSDAEIVADLLKTEGASDADYYYSGEATKIAWKKWAAASYWDFVEVLLISRQGGHNPILH